MSDPLVLPNGQHVRTVRPPLVVWFVLVPLVIAVLFVALYRHVDAKDNATRCAVVTLVERLSVNSDRSYRLTLASKTATPEQKRIARTNLDQLLAYERVTADALGHPHGAGCPVPPKS